MNTIARKSILPLIGIFFFYPVGAQAQMYACRDSSGTLQYTNVPNSGNCKPLGKKKSSSRRYWAPPSSYSASSYDKYIWDAGNRYNVDPHLIKAVIKAESAFNSKAVSKKGAQGLMQLMPGTARELSVRDPFNPKENINGGTRYLRRMLDTFNGNLVLSIAAYNAGPGAVSRAKGVPRIPETMRYVVKVLTNYKGYRNEGKS